MVGLVFTEQGTLFQHVAIVIVCATQLIVHARTQPYSTWTENALQYLGTFLTFAMSFGGMILQNMKVSHREAEQRLVLSAKELDDNKKSFKSVQDSIDAILYLVIISAVVVLGYEQWEKRQESKAKLGELCGKVKQSLLKVAVCCGCSTCARNHVAAAVRDAEDRVVVGQHTAGGMSAGGGVEMANVNPMGVEMGLAPSRQIQREPSTSVGSVDVVVEEGAAIATDGVRGGGGESGDVEILLERAARAESAAFGGGARVEGRVDSINPLITYAMAIEEKSEEKQSSGEPGTSADDAAATPAARGGQHSP